MPPRSNSDRVTRIHFFEKITLAFVFTVIVAGALLSHTDPALFENYLVVEDGVVEWLTVLGFIIAMVVCFRRAIRLRSRRPLRFTVATLLLGSAFLFCAGEEISWGQRIFQFESSLWFSAHNLQRETNLHNLKIGQVKINKVIFSWGVAAVLIIYFCVMTPLYGGRKSFANAVDGWALPIPRPHQVAACLAMITIAHFLVQSPKKPELSEFGGAFLLLLIVLFPRNQAIFDPCAEPASDRQQCATSAPNPSPG